MEPQVCPSSREEWRDWLKKNHAAENEVWLVYYKKHTGKPTVSYADSVKEALCFGWIDGIKKSIDHERYCHRFSPRKPRSNWSRLNISLARELIEQGKMAPAGLDAFERRRESASAGSPGQSGKETRLPRQMENVLKANAIAWKHFNDLAPGYRRQYVAWLTSAKLEATRARRLEQALDMLEKNLKPGM